MLTTPTLDKLYALNLSGMARAFLEQQARADYAALSFEERLGLLVDRETQDRDNRRLERNLRAARLRTSASIEELDFHLPRGLDRSLILSLAEGHWVAAHRNVLVVGPTGVGKTFVACALAHAALIEAHGNPNAASDVTVAKEMLNAGLNGARANVEINLPGVTDAAYVEQVRREL